MKDKMKITVVAGKSLPETLAKSFNALAEVLSAGIANTKLTAEKCFELRSNASFSEVFPDSDYKKIVDVAFNGVITGNTAYKYAQVYELYHENNDIWGYFPIGKMIITSRLESNKNKTGRSTIKFIQWAGIDYNAQVQAMHDAWKEKNAKLLEKIAFLEKGGYDSTSEKKLLSPEPDEKPYESTGKVNEDGEYFHLIGMNVILRKSDKELKELVTRYIDNNLTEDEKAEKAKKEAEKAEKADGEKAEEKPVDVLENAISAMVAYTSTLENIPAEYQKALLKLKADKAKRGDK